MIAEIIVKKVIQNGVKGFIFVDFKNILSPANLPSKYIKGQVICFYLTSKNIITVWSFNGFDPMSKKYDFKTISKRDLNEYNFRLYHIGDFISQKDFNKLIPILKQAGQRLTDINKELENNWVEDDKEITIKI